jgi:hypothetical protein
MRKAEQKAGVPRATAQRDPEKLAQNYIGTGNGIASSDPRSALAR